MTLMFMVICSIAFGLSFGRHHKAVMATLCFFRFWLGFGIGGDYPLSATIMSEYASRKTRGAFIAAVFAMQGFGILTGGMAAFIISTAFKAIYPASTYAMDPIRSTVPEAGYAWHIILVWGHSSWNNLQLSWLPILQNLLRLIWQKLFRLIWKQESRKLSRLLKIKKNDIVLFSTQFLHRHGLPFLGTAATWFLLDIAFFSQNLFQKDIFSFCLQQMPLDYWSKKSTYSAWCY
ncbi:hypothetical protein Ddye_018887 [Dipteronia dyeriana]|uniref:Inorganic phosphate transporter n=1 Tax=Dipteronia dyeriana TaxID=168575 RepID=A0AAD9TX97_9ROSI|nr:hypothetical protein Ddye_018883 [Dipteronia dyeriana]KAK2643692.1 hypothetical protein Ddye_018887 [Dipteronia dyeriana]